MIISKKTLKLIHRKKTRLFHKSETKYRKISGFLSPTEYENPIKKDDNDLLELYFHQ